MFLFSSRFATGTASSGFFGGIRCGSGRFDIRGARCDDVCGFAVRWIRPIRVRAVGALLLWSLALVALSQSRMETAEALYRQGRFRDAAQVLEALLRVTPTDAVAWQLVGLCHQQLGNFAPAERAFGEVVTARPRDSLAHFRLAQVRYRLGKFHEAEGGAKTSLNLGGNPGYIHNLLGLIQEEKHSYQEALESYAAAIRTHSDSFTEPYLNAGILLLNLKLGRPTEALPYLEKAVAGSGSAETLYHRGRARLELSHFAEAKRDLEKAVALEPHEPARRLVEQLRLGGIPTPPRRAPVGPEVEAIRFLDMARRANLQFVLENHPTPRKHIIETMPGGVAAFDYNNDGLIDIYFTNGAAIPSLAKTEPKYWNRLYRNEGGMRFTDVTREAGVAGRGYSIGVAAGDYDNDGHVDLFVTGVGESILFRNRGDGTFEDVTVGAKVQSQVWSVAAGWFDYDNDGLLDLFVVNYLRWSPDFDRFCGSAGSEIRSYCDPGQFEGLPSTLYRNRGDGTFEDASRRSGIGRHVGKGMSLALADYDSDGFMDVFVTNDTVANFLFRNRGDGTFEEVGLAAGVGLTDDGKAVSSMGADFRDYDNDGWPDIWVTALARETFPLFRNQATGYFRDVTYPSRVGLLSVRLSGWSNGLFDFNNDGWKDLFSANAHVFDNIHLFRPDVYRLPNSIFANQGDGTFRDVSREAGEQFQRAAAHRGAAFADFNGDGRVDVVVTALGEPIELWENRSPGGSHWILVKLEGTHCNRDGIGARVRLDGQFNHMTTAVGYASSSYHGVHFGLGPRNRVATVQVSWPCGRTQSLQDVPANQVLRLREPEAGSQLEHAAY
jgi:enediyne biosynthesis protein E4